MSVHSPLSPLIDLEVLDLTPQDLLMALGEKLMGVYRTAYGWAGNRGALESNLKTLVDETLAHQLEVGHRRIFVKAWIRLLDEDRRTGGRVLDAREVLTVMQRAEEALSPDDEDEFEDD
ncbi:MAG: hypothetical protein HY815_26660 [Candidatus Riflebacteria bacterium]|nr:hypothetical protein [Candidatus Riflebacteria bacterium]